MKIVQISDIHLRGEPILGTDPNSEFESCLAHVERHHADADHVVVTGDLVHDGERRDYERLRDRLDASPLAVRLMLGNHDDRETFRAVFPAAPDDGHGFVQWSEDRGGLRLIHLDTLLPGSHAGELCERRLGWLQTQLDGCERALVFMHHPPLQIGVANADIIGLHDAERVAATLVAVPGKVRHVFFGHCHYQLSGSVRGVPFSAAQSTSHPNWPEIGGPAERTGYAPEQSRSYAVALVRSDSLVVHTIEYAMEERLRWLTYGE